MQTINIVVNVHKKIFKSCMDEKFYLRSNLKLILTLRLTLGLQLGLTTRKTK